MFFGPFYVELSTTFISQTQKNAKKRLKSLHYVSIIQSNIFCMDLSKKKECQAWD